MVRYVPKLTIDVRQAKAERETSLEVCHWFICAMADQMHVATSHSTATPHRLFFSSPSLARILRDCSQPGIQLRLRILPTYGTNNTNMRRIPFSSPPIVEDSVRPIDTDRLGYCTIVPCTIILGCSRPAPLRPSAPFSQYAAVALSLCIFDDDALCTSSSPAPTQPSTQTSRNMALYPPSLTPNFISTTSCRLQHFSPCRSCAPF